MAGGVAIHDGIWGFMLLFTITTIETINPLGAIWKNEIYLLVDFDNNFPNAGRNVWK